MAVAAPPVLEVEGLGKKLTRDLVKARRYGIAAIADELKLVSRPADRPLRPEEFWAIRDITFSVAPGEALGIVGHNGAGKSTLLRVLTGITRPDAGKATIRGPHTALLDLGAPFNRLLSGRENIITAAALHGLERSRTAELIEAVADFAELADVLDAPMWTYSTGMGMRLGYAIAAQLQPKLLLVDEIIAVGDISFQRKCVNHIRTHLANGGALVLVSHDLWMIQALCDRCLVMASGEVEVEGTPNRAISTYMRVARKSQVFIPRTRTGFTDPIEEPTHPAEIEIIGCAGPDGALPKTGDDLAIDLMVRSGGEQRRAAWHVDVLTANRQTCLARLAPPPGDDVVELGDDPTTFSFVVPDLPLFPGLFSLSAHLDDPETGDEIGVSESQVPLEVESRDLRIDTLAQIAGALSAIECSYELGPMESGDPTAPTT